MNNSKSSLFLMELIIVILFFSVSAAVCVQLFFNAHSTDISTNELSHAEIAMQNICEGYIALDGDIERLANEYSNCTYDTTSCAFAYDSEWNPVTPGSENAVYLVNVSDTSLSAAENDMTNGGFIKNATIVVSNTTNDTMILSQDIKKYIPYSN